MADNAHKTPLARSLESFAQRKVAGVISMLGKAVPAQVVTVTGSIVTVKFLVQSPYTLPSVTVPLAGPEYARPPIQVGDKGVVFPADVYIGGVSGLGSGTADLSQPASLSALVFFPIGSKLFSPTDDPNSYLLYGPDGAIIRNTAKTAVLKVTTLENSWTPPSGEPVVINGNVVINGGLALSGKITAADGVSTYAEAIETAGAIIAGYGTGDQVGLQSHTHTQPDDSAGDTEEPTTAPTPGT